MWCPRAGTDVCNAVDAVLQLDEPFATARCLTEKLWLFWGRPDDQSSDRCLEAFFSSTALEDFRQ